MASKEEWVSSLLLLRRSIKRLNIFGSLKDHGYWDGCRSYALALTLFYLIYLFIHTYRQLKVKINHPILSLCQNSCLKTKSQVRNMLWSVIFESTEDSQMLYAELDIQSCNIDRLHCFYSLSDFGKYNKSSVIKNIRYKKILRLFRRYNFRCLYQKVT